MFPGCAAYGTGPTGQLKASLARSTWTTTGRRIPRSTRPTICPELICHPLVRFLGQPCRGVDDDRAGEHGRITFTAGVATAFRQGFDRFQWRSASPCLLTKACVSAPRTRPVLDGSWFQQGSLGAMTEFPFATEWDRAPQRRTWQSDVTGALPCCDPGKTNRTARQDRQRAFAGNRRLTPRDRKKDFWGSGDALPQEVANLPTNADCILQRQSGLTVLRYRTMRGAAVDPRTTSSTETRVCDGSTGVPSMTSTRSRTPRLPNSAGD
jgi:hypothetical protein